MTPKIGFIGVGIMGRHMAGHLLESGYEVIAYDVVSEALDRVVKAGSARGQSCQDVASRSDVVISMVPDSPDVERVALGPDGIIQAMGTHTIGSTRLTMPRNDGKLKVRLSSFEKLEVQLTTIG